MAAPEALSGQALRLLCAAGGCLTEGELCRRLQLQDNPALLALLLGDARRFTLATREEAPSAGQPAEHRVVVATGGLRLCGDHGGGKCAGRCGRLHLCRFFVYGWCRRQDARKQCKFIHDFHTPHNLCVLKEHGLESLSSDELCQLLLQNDPSLLPELCPYYNKGDGPYGACTFKKICVKLHICQYYLQGDCRFGSNCRRSHDVFNPECYEKLEKWGMSRPLISRIPLIYRNIHDIKNGTKAPCKERSETSGQNQLSTNNKEESDVICLYHIRKNCSFKDKCIRVHFHLPYRWQISDGTEWKDLPHMERIEQAYCDPCNERISYSYTGKSSNHPVIDFCKMTCGSAALRRLSTESSVTKPPHYILATDWIWYWKDEYEVWNEYGKPDVDHAAASVLSLDLEKAYQYGAPLLKFAAAKHEYELDFKAMKQKNLRYLTERDVRRRPKFVSQKEVERKKASGAEQSKGGPTLIPMHWDQSALPELGYELITLPDSSNEYRKVQVNFQRTMPRAKIVKIERIQNLSLWQVYQWQKDQMKKANGGKDVDERLLFHGTNKIHADAICQQNFDWRICGVHGVAYGKGSYFARDASYSDNYTKSDSSNRIMFLARVLVGEFTSGLSSYARPPTKDNQATFFDSCVNNVQNPSIFVIFEKHQIYPEYLIKYQS